MNHLKVRALIDIDSTELPDILGSRLGLWIEDTAVADLEQFLRNWLLLVLLEALEETRQQRGAHDLKFNCLWVTQLHAL